MHVMRNLVGNRKDSNNVTLLHKGAVRYMAHAYTVNVKLLGPKCARIGLLLKVNPNHVSKLWPLHVVFDNREYGAPFEENSFCVLW